MTNREWVKGILAGDKSLPVGQNWMGYFNGEAARKLTPSNCHYEPMWLYDCGDEFETNALGRAALDGMIAFNEYTDRCLAALGRGANISFGHGGPGEFVCRVIERSENSLVAEYETGVRAKVQFDPHFYHSYDHPVKAADDLAALSLPDAGDDRRYAGFAADAEYLRSTGQYVTGSLNGFFSGIHYFVMDYAETLMALIADCELINAILDRLGEWNVTAAGKMVEAGADCIVLCDDLGSKLNLLMSPEQYRSFFKPWHRKVCERVHQLGGTVHLHSHGAITPILDDIAECGFDFVNPFDPEEGHDIEEVLRKYSEAFVVCGGFSTSFWQLDSGKQEEYLDRMGELGRRYGRFIFMDSGGVPDTVSKEDYDRINVMSRKARRVDDGGGAF